MCVVRYIALFCHYYVNTLPDDIFTSVMLLFTASLLEVKMVKRGKKSKDFEDWTEDSENKDSTKCFVLFYSSEFKYKTLSIAGGFFFIVVRFLFLRVQIQSIINEVFRHVGTLIVQGRNLVPSRLVIVWQGLFTFRQLITGLLGTRFLPWTNKVSTRQKAL